MAPDLSPNLATPLTSITPILPFICPAHRSVLISAHSPGAAQNRPKCSFWYKQTALRGSEGSMGSRTGLEELSWVDKGRHAGGSACFTAKRSSHLDAVFEALQPPPGGKNLRVSTISFKPTIPCKTNYKYLHILYSEHPQQRAKTAIKYCPFIKALKR